MAIDHVETDLNACTGFTAWGIDPQLSRCWGDCRSKTLVFVGFDVSSELQNLFADPDPLARCGASMPHQSSENPNPGHPCFHKYLAMSAESLPEEWCTWKDQDSDRSQRLMPQNADWSFVAFLGKDAKVSGALGKTCSGKPLFRGRLSSAELWLEVDIDPVGESLFYSGEFKSIADTVYHRSFFLGFGSANARYAS